MCEKGVVEKRGRQERTNITSGLLSIQIDKYENIIYLKKKPEHTLFSKYLALFSPHPNRSNIIKKPKKF